MKKLGPFGWFWGPKKRFLDVHLWARPNAPYGWAWGRDGQEALGDVEIALGPFRVFSFLKYKEGFGLHILGFWWVK